MFQPVPSKVSFPQLEEDVLQFWRDIGAFHRSEREREGSPLFVLYEGPPTANGEPGIHHVLSRVFKDIIPRYKTMRGFQPLRKGGWDTHGLPVELEVERELGISSKREIEEYGIEAFNRRCRESVFRYVREWERLTERIAFWIDMESAYVTYENSYIETGWWIIRQLWDRGLVYLGMSSVPHCPRCVTTLSSHEVALGYKEDTPDPSVYVLFRLADTPQSRGKVRRRVAADGDTYLMAWTTTPWTLPGNTALAVSPGADYLLVGLPDGRRVILAAALASTALLEKPQVLATFKGADLEGLRYHPLYNPFEFTVPVQRFQADAAGSGGVEQLGEVAREEVEPLLYPVAAADFVSMEEGTGIVHIAPAFGADDYELGKARGLLFVQQVDLTGNLLGTYPFAGRFVKDADPLIMEDLAQRGLLYRQGVYRHTYPFCWRCDTPLLYYAKPSWYIRTTAVKERLLSGNQEINWYPEHVKEGRFGEWLRNNVDWAISRERYWGTPLPIWQCQGCAGHHCVGGVEEMKHRMTPESYTRLRLDLLKRPEDLHRPYVDEAVLRCYDCGGNMYRVPHVMDCWFDSGAMPFAQWHYPLEHREEVDSGRFFPADYICEAVDQTRGWFYSLHALATLLKDAPCYRNVICLGHILDAKGEKMSKSRGNVVDPWDVINAHGADALRWYLFTATPPGNSRRFSTGLVEVVVRRFFLPVWNVYSFFVTYANLDGVSPQDLRVWAALDGPGSGPVAELDRWLLSELNLLVRQVTEGLEGYNPTDAGRRIEEFVELLSNWYVRRSRRRFWKSENDEDKRSAYVALYQALATLCRLLAPFTPFLAEAMYQNLVRSGDPQGPDSVHLALWPEVVPEHIDETLSREVTLVRRVTSLGRAARSRAHIKVRQPLQRLLVKSRSPEEAEVLLHFQAQLLEELNVKELALLEDATAAQFIALHPDGAKLGPRLGAQMPQLLRAFQEADQLQVYTAAMAGQPVEVGGFTLTSDEVRMELGEVEGYAAAMEAGYLVAVTTQLSSELAEEGLARELVHRVQNMRRSAGFDIADRIVTYWVADQRVRQVMHRFGDYIRQETLSQELRDGAPSDQEAYQEEHRLDGTRVLLAVQRLSP